MQSIKSCTIPLNATIAMKRGLFTSCYLIAQSNQFGMDCVVYMDCVV